MVPALELATAEEAADDATLASALDAAEDAALAVFRNAVAIPDFGNGRFVRTLLEQAWLKQSQRIIKENEGGSVTKEDLTRFKVEDFDVNLDKKFRDERKLGFVR